MLVYYYKLITLFNVNPFKKEANYDKSIKSVFKKRDGYKVEGPAILLA